jgi:hypothetical protein
VFAGYPESSIPLVPDGLGRHTARSVVGYLTSPRFVGRRAELDALRAALDRTADRVGSLVLVGGEAGIGKSRLIAKLAA